MKIFGVIPARGGSKGIPKKNIINLNGQPLIGYSIITGLLSNTITDIFVTTDDDYIAEISESFGANVLMRPKKLATDTSRDIEWVTHFLSFYNCDYIAILRPTTPIRDTSVVDKAINCFLEDKNATGFRTFQECKINPCKMFKLGKNNYYESFLEKNNKLTKKFGLDKFKEYCNLPRQILPRAFEPNDYIDIIKKDIVLDTNTLYGNKITGMLTEKTVVIDTYADLVAAKFAMDFKDNLLFS